MREKIIPKIFKDIFIDDKIIVESKPILDIQLLLLGDSLEILKESIKSNSIDLIFADPPPIYDENNPAFNNSKLNLFDIFGFKESTIRNGIKHTIQLYVNWGKKWIDECMRVLKDTGTMYFTAPVQVMPFLDVYVSSKYNVLSRIIWTYDKSEINSKKNI